MRATRGRGQARRVRGLTLIELLVALVILALVAMMAYRGLNGLIAARDRVAAEQQKWRAIDLTFRRLDQDLRLALDRPARNAAGGLDPALIAAADGDGGLQLALTRAGTAAQGAGRAPQRFGYRYKDGTLSQLGWPVLDAAPSTQPAAATLLEHVSEFRLEFLDRQGQWLPQWPAAGGPVAQPGGYAALPVAARAHLTLQSGETFERLFLVGR